MLLELSKGMTI